MTCPCRRSTRGAYSASAEEVANNKLVQEAYFGVEDDEILAGEVETHA